MTELLQTRQLVKPGEVAGYLHHPFLVPSGVNVVRLSFSYPKRGRTNIMISLHDPQGFRGSRMNSYPFGRGHVELEMWVAPDSASPGAWPGPVHPGEWRVQVDVERLATDTEYQLKIEAEHEADRQDLPQAVKSDPVLNGAPGWYQGELHAHSRESDGKQPVAAVINAARGAGLDFLALTEHNTNSHWSQLPANVSGQMALLYSCELTSHQGHANLHGLSEWVDVFIDRPGIEMNGVADKVHAQGGLFCVNHPFSGELGWRVEGFDWDKVDLLEIYHNLEGANNNFHGPLWDHHLRMGRRIVGVAGIDSHDALAGLHRLGQLCTWVYAPYLSEAGILEGLREGRVYVSRGPELRFTAVSNRGRDVEMWETLEIPGGAEVELRAKVRSAEAVMVHLLKNGYPYLTRHVEPGGEDWQVIVFRDVPRRSCYYRLELHEVFNHDQYKGVAWRDHSTMRALSNPIWIRLLG